MAKKFKKMSREELKEFKNGKYMGGPAEERAEKKGRRMAVGGMTAPVRMGSRMGGAGNPFIQPRTTRQIPGESGNAAPSVSQTMMRRMMRGGGLARKGVGMALAKGGMVKGAGCVKRGVKKAKNY